MEDRLAKAEQELVGIRERNRNVEDNKAWETSLARIGSIALITYAVVSVVLLMIGGERPFLSALVPVIGYLLSTQSLPIVRKLWSRSRRTGAG